MPGDEQSAQRLRVLQTEYIADLQSDADKLCTTALDIARLVAELESGLATGGQDWSLGAHMGAAQAQLLSLHVRYAAVMAMRIGEIRVRLEGGHETQ